MSLLTDLYTRVVELTNRLNAIGAHSKTTQELPTMFPVTGDALVRVSKGGNSYKTNVTDLLGEITSGGYLGNVPSTFKTATIDFDDPIGTPITKVRDFINAMPNHVIPNGYAQWFRTYRAVLTNGSGLAVPAGGGSHFAIITEYYLLTNKIPPVNGVVSIGTGGTQITTAALMKLYERDSRSAEPVEYDLGDIASDEIWDAVDGTGPRSVPNTVTTLFRAIQGGTEKIWLYIGGQEEVGTGYPVTDAGDYREISSDGSGMDPAPPSVFTFHEYDDIAAMQADQSNQTAGDLILVKDAGADTNITFEVGETRKQAMYKRKGSVATDTIADYLLVAVPYGNGGGTGGAFDPTDYDLDEFNNASADPFVRNSELGDVAKSNDYNDLDNLPDLLALGETASTAYRGDRGKIAYEHSQITSGNPHDVTKADVGLDNVPNTDFTSAVEANTLKRSYPIEDENKLAGIEEGAEVNVQSDFAQNDSGADDFIKNKPPTNPQKLITATRLILATDNGNTLFLNGTGLEITFDPIEQSYHERFTVAGKNESDTEEVTLILKGITGWSYKLNDSATAALTTGVDVNLTVYSGATFTLIKKTGENKIYIDGGVE